MMKFALALLGATLLLRPSWACAHGYGGGFRQFTPFQTVLPVRGHRAYFTGSTYGLSAYARPMYGFSYAAPLLQAAPCVHYQMLQAVPYQPAVVPEEVPLPAAPRGMPYAVGAAATYSEGVQSVGTSYAAPYAAAPAYSSGYGAAVRQVVNYFPYRTRVFAQARAVPFYHHPAFGAVGRSFFRPFMGGARVAVDVGRGFAARAGGPARVRVRVR